MMVAEGFQFRTTSAWRLAHATYVSVLPWRQIVKVRNDRDGGLPGEESTYNAGDPG